MKVTDFKAAELLDAINTMSRIHVKCLLVVMDTEENMSDQLISAMHRSISTISTREIAEPRLGL